MARLEYENFTEILNDMRELGELTGPTADAMLVAGAKQVQNAWLVSAMKHRHRDSGEMIRSIRPDDKPRTLKGERIIDVYSRGVDLKRPKKDGGFVSNEEKAFLTNYGKKGVNGSHWIDEADKLAAPLIFSEWERIWNDYLKERGF